MMKKITSLILLLLVFSIGNSQIVAWDMSGNNGDEITMDATTEDSNLNTVTLSRGSGIIERSLINGFSSRAFTVGGTQADAITNNEYLEFQISAVTNYEVSLTTLNSVFYRSATGPDTFIWKYSLDGVNFTDIGTSFTYTGSGGGGTNQAAIDLSGIGDLQNVLFGTTITIRLYAWGATSSVGTFAIGRTTGDNLRVVGTVAIAPCPGGTVTWNGTTWSNAGIGPDTTTEAVISGSYDTATFGSFSACSLTVNAGINLNVSNGTYIEVENDVVVDGDLTVQNQGNFVQNDNGGSFTLNGTSSVNKQTPPKADWFYYTYWSSPVVGESIGDAFPNAPADRRFWFNAANFVDNNADDIDDNADDWQYALAGDTMTPGMGYAATESRFHFPGATGTATFEGQFNTGDIPVVISLNVANTGVNWNFIGNPYPSALEFDAFQAANSGIIDGAAYFWSQASPPSELNPGNEGLNFNLNDYAVYTVGSGGTAGGTPEIPTGNIGSCQGFFVPALSAGTATFTNAMRIADGTSNSQFFKNNGTKTSNTGENKLWLNLTSGNGVFNQVLVAYVNGATDANDGMYYDAPKFLAQNYAAALYTLSNSDNVRYAIQGKSMNSIDENETIKLGLSTNIEVATIYSLSLDHFEGDFISNNAVYLKDNLTNTIHNLSDSDYSFISEVGEFNERFEITFNASSLSNDTFEVDTNTIKIVQLDSNNVKFTTETSNFTSITIHDLFGRTLYKLDANSNDETYNLNVLKNSVYIATLELANGTALSKKFIKK